MNLFSAFFIFIGLLHSISSTYAQKLDIPECAPELVYSKQLLEQAARDDRIVKFHAALGHRIVLIQDYWVTACDENITAEKVRREKVLFEGRSELPQFTVFQRGGFLETGILWKVPLITSYDVGVHPAGETIFPIQPLPPKLLPLNPAEITVAEMHLDAPLTQTETNLIRKKLKQKLIFGLPEETNLVFLVDASGSMNFKINEKTTNLSYALEQLEKTVLLLDGKQKFVIGFFSDHPVYFNGGVAVNATPENVQKAIRFLRQQNQMASGSLEEAGKATKLLTQGFKADAIYFFSDFDLTSGDTSDLRNALTAANAKVYLKRMYRTEEKNLANIVRFYPSAQVLDKALTLESSLEELKQMKQLIEQSKTFSFEFETTN